MRRIIVGCALLALFGVFAGQYAIAQDEPATPVVYSVECGTPLAASSPAADDAAIGTVDPQANATVENAMELAGMDATPEASPGVYVCASPEATPSS
jgi:hypothetical protein